MHNDVQDISKIDLLVSRCSEGYNMVYLRVFGGFRSVSGLHKAKIYSAH